MKKIFLFFIVFSLESNLYAQMLITGFNTSLLTSTSIQDIWNFSVINTANSSIRCRVQIDVQSTDHKRILRGNSVNLELVSGPNNVSYNLVSPVNYEYSNSPIASAIMQDAMLPSGEYIICIRILNSTEGAILSEGCFNVSAVNNSFFSLIYPTDMQTIDELNPVLNWTPLSESGIEYQVFLSPMQKGTSKKEILRSGLYLNGERVSQPSLLYPVYAPPLEYGKEYLWYVKALKNEKQIAESQIWSFKVANFAKKKDSDCYRVISSGLNSGFYVSGNILRFAYDNRTNQPNLSCAFKESQGEKKINSNVQLSLVPGINKIDIDLSKIQGLSRNNYYTVTLLDHNATYLLSFYYSKTSE